MKKDFALELHKILSESLDRKFKEQTPVCPNFYRTIKGKAFCRIGHNKKVIGMSKRGQPYETYLPDCKECERGANSQ